MSSTLTQAQRQLRSGEPLRLDQVTGLMQRGIDASVVEQHADREELSGFRIIDEKDFAGDYSEDRDFQRG